MRILLTGASRGIGAAIASALGEAGHSVVGVSRGLAPPSAASHAVASWVHADLDTETGIAGVVAAAGRLDGAVFAAGIVQRGPFARMPAPGAVDSLSAQILANLEAPLRLLRALLVSGQLGAGSSVVMLSSTLPRHTVPNHLGYTVAKGGVEAAVRALARELGPAGIRVNGIAPGLMRTDMTAELSEAILADYAAGAPLGRVGMPEDIAPLAMFLLGAGARYITGQVIDVDGGWCT